MSGIWETSTRLFEMLALADRWLDDRKRRLFAVACCRRFTPHFRDRRSLEALDVAQRYADGRASEEERQGVEQAALDVYMTVRERWSDEYSLVRWDRQDEVLARAALSAIAVGKFHAEDAADRARWAVSAGGRGWHAEQDEEAAQCALLREIIGPFPVRDVPVDPFWLAANDGAAAQLARWIEERSAFEDLLILADALEEAGCADAAILDHCRRPGEHVAGCWVVDLVLGKS